MNILFYSSRITNLDKTLMYCHLFRPPGPLKIMPSANHLVHDLQFLVICLVQGPQIIVNHLVHDLQFLVICSVQGPPIYSTIWYMTSRFLTSVRSRAPQFIVNHLVHDLQFIVIYLVQGPPIYSQPFGT